MSIAFSPATPQRFQEICALYQDVIRDMHARGLKQWEWDVYPTRAQLEDDITHGRLYRVEEMCIRDSSYIALGALVYLLQKMNCWRIYYLWPFDSKTE